MFTKIAFVLASAMLALGIVSVVLGMTILAQAPAPGTELFGLPVGRIPRLLEDGLIVIVASIALSAIAEISRSVTAAPETGKH
ncbi:hypothetical protein [Anianabacter salinae]|uniref:hypothetical protein n=1 Tax=Anianabacter salinae TaxID=2851023 RepID=UPI00225E3887|nr:hypothetical protein [Anianabacter salinae]MBV0911815.1 hypothetical protein [Anianabacter salinae]